MSPEEWAQLNAAVTNTNQAFAPIFANAKPAPAPARAGPPDYLVNGQHYSNFNDALAAETPTASASSPSTSSTRSLPTTTPRSPLTPSGSASDVSTPSSGVNATLSSLLNGTGSTPPSGAPTTTGSGPSGAVNLTPTDPNNPLTAQTISVGPTADRFGIAKDQIQNVIQNILNPQFAADQRTLAQNAAARGQVGSGMLRTNLGNLDLARQRDIDATTSSFLNNALSGSIDDAYKNVGIAQQQQGFQNEQQQEAFNNGLQELLAGSSGDPSQLLLALSGIYSGQANAGANAAANYGANSTANAATNDPYLQLLKTIEDMNTNTTLNGILNNGIPGVQTTPGGGY